MSDTWQQEQQRMRLADNPDTDPDTLADLAGDRVDLVRSAVARNPHTSPDTLTRLADDPQKYVRAVVAKNPHTPQATLEAMRVAANSPGPMFASDVAVLGALADNLNASPALLRRLVKSNTISGSVGERVARNPNTPVDLLAELSHSSSRYVRQAVAAHPNLPEEDRQRLRTDQHPEVRYAAGRSTKPPPPFLFVNEEVGYPPPPLLRLADRLMQASGSVPPFGWLLLPFAWVFITVVVWPLSALHLLFTRRAFAAYGLTITVLLPYGMALFGLFVIGVVFLWTPLDEILEEFINGIFGTCIDLLDRGLMGPPMCTR